MPNKLDLIEALTLPPPFIFAGLRYYHDPTVILHRNPELWMRSWAVDSRSAVARDADTASVRLVMPLQIPDVQN